jgi:hypothetical protein
MDTFIGEIEKKMEKDFDFFSKNIDSTQFRDSLIEGVETFLSLHTKV